MVILSSQILPTLPSAKHSPELQTIKKEEEGKKKIRHCHCGGPATKKSSVYEPKEADTAIKKTEQNTINEGTMAEKPLEGLQR